MASEPVLRPQDEPGLVARNLFVRHRNVLMTRADLCNLYVDYYLHLKDNAIEVSPRHDDLFKTSLAAFVLHLASRPRYEMLSWTLSFQQPLVNLFLVGDNETGTVSGRVFSEGVKQAESNSFYQEVVRRNQRQGRSFVAFEGNDPLLAAEHYYDRSEQRPAKFFQVAEEEFVMVGAHPDYDEDWFRQIDLPQVQAIAEEEELSLLETRAIRWVCGCGREKILEVLAPVAQQDMQSLFQEDPAITVNCPRCAAKYEVTREEMEAKLAALQQTEQ